MFVEPHRPGELRLRAIQVLDYLESRPGRRASPRAIAAALRERFAYPVMDLLFAMADLGLVRREHGACWRLELDLAPCRWSRT